MHKLKHVALIKKQQAVFKKNIHQLDISNIYNGEGNVLAPPLSSRAILMDNYKNNQHHSLGNNALPVLKKLRPVAVLHSKLVPLASNHQIEGRNNLIDAQIKNQDSCDGVRPVWWG